MTERGWKISEFAGIIAVLGALVLVGVWDNERTIRHNLDAGYDTSAMVTGANEQHRFPLTFDGLRPRFLDETYSLNLAWRGRDGIERTRQQVPVSDEYMASLLVDRDKVRLVPVPIKVIDQEGAVPTIAPDVSSRLQHLNQFATWVGYGTAVATLVFVVSLGARWLRSRTAAIGAESGLEPSAWHIPPRLTILTVFCLGAAVMFGYYSFKDSRDAEAVRGHGRDVTAAITGFHSTVNSDHTMSYLIDLSWRDGSGAERHFGPTHVSVAFARRIAPNGALNIRQTAIRYLEEDASARPIILADADEQSRNNAIGRVMAAVFGVAGVVLAAVTAWRSQRLRTHPA
jgi:hypothetical protein